jgi:hypothetical protein
VAKLWSYFVPTPPDARTQSDLETLYVNSGFGIRPVVEAILQHPDVYRGAPLVKPPAVFTAGLLRARGRTITTANWAWRSIQAGQFLFHPPNVAGWKDQAWLDTATVRGRWYLVHDAISPEMIDPWNAGYPPAETPAEALDRALEFWGRPSLTPETRAELERFAVAAIPAVLHSWERGPLRAMRQNALRHLIVASPDLQTS